MIKECKEFGSKGLKLTSGETRGTLDGPLVIHENKEGLRPPCFRPILPGNETLAILLPYK